MKNDHNSEKDGLKILVLFLLFSLPAALAVIFLDRVQETSVILSWVLGWIIIYIGYRLAKFLFDNF